MARPPLDMDALRSALDAEKGAPHVETALARYADDPVGFARDVLGVEPWSRERELLEACARNARVACRAGHRVSKDHGAVIVALWFACTRPLARVIMTAPTARQVREVLWRELRLMYRSARVPLGGTLAETPAGGLRWDDGREVLGLATDEAERFQGYAGSALMFIVDEASGVAEEIFEALRGNLAGGGRVLLIGNPTRTSGTFFDAFESKARLWHPLHIPSTASPNVTGEAAIPGLATPEWIAAMAEDYGEESPVFAARVLGEFPKQAADAVISLALVDAAKEAWLSTMRDGGRTFATLGVLEVGVDVARFGDDESVIIARRGPVALPPVTARGLDTVALSHRVLEVVNEHRRANELPIVRVDVVGVGGGVVDVLCREPSIVVEEVNAGASPSSPTFMRVRDELWWTLRDWLRAGGALPSDPKLEAELLAPTYSYGPTGRISVEEKSEIKKRLRRSPDRADALALAVYRPAPRSDEPLVLIVPTMRDDVLRRARDYEM